MPDISDILHWIEGSVCQYVTYLYPFTVESELLDGESCDHISSCGLTTMLIY